MGIMGAVEWRVIAGIGQNLVMLAIIAGIIAAIVVWTRRQGVEGEPEGLEGGREEDRGMGTIKRLYFYAGTFVYMTVAAVGVTLVADYVLDELFGPEVLDRSRVPLSAGVVLALIWTPVWIWHRLKVARFVDEEPAERRSILRKVYVYLTLLVTAGMASYGASELLSWALGNGSFSGHPLAFVVVWGGLWAFHWAAESAEGQPTDETKTVRRLYLYAVSAYSLAMLAAGLSLVIYLVLRDAYEGLFDVPVLLREEEALWGETMRDVLSIALVGGCVWSFHWLYAARHDAGSDVRQFYLHVPAILGGVVTVLSASGVIAFAVLQWLIGTPEETEAAAHFRVLPGAISPLLIGLVLWLYHWAVVEREQAARGELPAAKRIYGYIMTALGIGALAAAIIVLVPTVVGIAATSARDVDVGGDWWRDRLAAALTLGLLGSPVWGYYWFAMQRRAAAGGEEERTSFPRRILIYGALVVGALAVLGSISHLLYLCLNALLENELSLTILREGKWSMGTFVAGALFVPYYWLVLQEDRQAIGERAARPAAPRKSVTVLMAEGGGTFLSQIEAVLGEKVRVLHRVDPGIAVPDLSAEDFENLERRIAEAAGSRVLLVPDATGVQLYSYR